MQNLHSFLIILLVFNFCMVILSSNPVHSVLFLILSFCVSASILLMFKIDFLGILFVIIYVGAIAVLFLFVVMMLNVKIFAIEFFYAPLIPLFLLFFIFTFSFLGELFNNNTSLYYLGTKLETLDSFYNIDLFGQIFYGYFVSLFLLGGIILLVAMLGAIILTLSFRSKRTNELVNRQLSRTDNSLSFFK